MTTITTPTPDATMVAAYAAASVGEKNRMRSAIGDAIGAAVVAASMGDTDALARAATLVATRDAFGPATPDRPAVDYGMALANRRATLVAALAAIRAGDYVLPDGATVNGDIPWLSGTPDAAMVRDYATVTGRKNGRGAVVPFIVAALATGSGPMTASDIHNAWSAVGATDDYPTAGPSVGAIGAAFMRVLNGADGADDYGFDVTTNATGTRVASLS